MIGKKVLAIILSIFFSTLAFAQQVTLTGFVPASYGTGGNITVPISLNGCFALNNQFNMYLSDASGNFTNATLVGSYPGFYSCYVNGVIPAATPAGNGYKVRITSTNPATSVESGSFSIATTSVPTVPNPLASSSNTINDSTFGRCLVTSNQVLTLQSTVPAGYTLSAVVKDSIGNSVSANVTANQIIFTMIQGNYYTVKITFKNNVDNTVSERSFLVLATNNNLSLQTSGATDVCLPDTKGYTINITGNGGIKNNYPGTQYSIEWGDGVINTYTQCELIAREGLLLHDYVSTSCGQAPITDLNPVQYNAYRVNVRARNEFCPNSFTSITTYSKVWQKPIADFINPVYGCINTPIKFPNTSQAGLSGYNNVVNCKDVAVYEWYVDGVLIFNAPKDLIYTFTTTGYHTVRLVASNDPCSNEITKQICIEEPLKPNFKINGQDSLSGCAPLTVNVDNLTTFDNSYQCRPSKWIWSVLLRPSMQTAVLGIDYTIQPNDSATNPSFTFLKPGEYFIRLAVANSCGTNYKDLPVTITDIAGVSFNVTTMRYCGTKTIDFGSDPNHRPVYNSNSGNETYKWTITGGSYSFVGGTSSTDAYPKIQFNDFATYTIAVQFQNSCGTKTATQQITFDESVTATAVNDTTICNNTTLLQLNASYTGPVATGTWSIINGSGSLSNPTIPNPTYTFSNGDRTTGTVTLRYTVNPNAGSACASASDDVVITLLPKNIITSTSEKTICTGSIVNYKPIALLGSTYTWTSTVIAGNVTGNTASGTGIINDVLTNNSTSVNGVVKYTITPLKNGCNGEVFNLIVTVIPKPDLQVTPLTDTICTGTSTNISLSSSYTAALFKWTATLTSGTVTGFSSQLVPSATNKINQVLINTGSTLATVTYTITAAASDTTACDGETKTVTVVVRPGATVANAGVDQLLCNQTSAVLNGNAATVGVGSWIQVNGPASTIVNPTLFNTAVNGLSANNTYKYVWAISGVGQCPSTSDTVTVAIRPASTIANAGNDIVVCDFVTTGSVKLNGNVDTTKSYESHYWTIISQPTNGNATLSDSTNPAATFTFNASGVYKLIWTIANDAGCSPTKDTVVINVFDKPVAGPIIGNTNICVGSDVTITLANYIGEIKKWQYNPAPVNDNIWKDTVVTTSVINFTNVADSFAVRVIIESTGKSFGCTSTDTSNVLIINATPKTIPGITGPSATVCKSANSGTVTLSGNNGKIVRWEFSVDNGTTWTAMVDTTTSITYNNLTVTTLYRAIVQNGNCGNMPSSATTITVLNPVTQAVAGVDQLICSASTTMNGNAPSQGEKGKWTQLSGPNNAVLFNDTTSTVTASSLIAGTYQFIWTLSNGSCAPTSDTINVVVRPAITVANAGNDIVVCDFVTSASVNLNANSDSTRTSESHIWTILSQPTNGYGVLSNPTSPASTFTFNALGTYQLVWTITNDAGCPPTKDTVTINVFDKPVAGPISGNTNICIGNSVTITLASHNGNIKKWQYNTAPINDNIWKDTLVTASTITFNNVADTFAVRVIVESLGASFGCAATDTSNTLVINAAPLTIPGTTGNSAAVCKSANNGTITLTGNTGKIVRWEYSADNGNTWTAMPDTTSSVTYKNLAVTTLYRAIVQSANCGVLPSTITTITVLEPVTQALVGADQLICNSSTTLEGNAPVQNEKGQWSQITGPNTAVFSNDTTALVTVSSLTTGTYKFVWTLSNASCPSTSDTVTVNVRPAITVANAGNDIVVCDFVSTRSISLNANADTSRTFENHQWSILSQPNNGYGILSNPANPASTFSFSATGTYQLVWTITNDAGCPPTKDTVTINVYDKPVAGPITAITDYCGESDVVVSLSRYTGAIKKWQYNPAPLNDNIWRDTLVTTPTITFSKANDSFAVRVIVEAVSANNVCASTDTSNTLIINITPSTVPGITGPGDSVCYNNNSGTITLKGNVGKVVRWEFSQGANWNVINDTSTSITYTNLTTTTYYRAIVQSGQCGIMPSSVTAITVFSEVTKAIAGPDQLICSSSTQLSGNTPYGSDLGTWNQISGPNTATLSSTTTPSITAYNLIGGRYQFVWSITNGVCSPSADTVTVDVRPAITPANAGNDTVICNFTSPASINLHGSSNSGRSFEATKWTIISKPLNSLATLSDATDPNAIFNYNAAGTYQLEWTITNDAGCTPTKDTITITVVPKPVAGLITANPNVCFGTDVVVTMGSYTGVIKKWQYNPAPINDNIWIDTLTTSSNINFLNVKDTFSVRAIVESNGAGIGCYAVDTSNTIIVNVIPATIPGTTGPVDTVCKGSNNGTILLKGNNGRIIRWEFSENNGSTWSNINDTTTAYNYTNLVTTTLFRAIVESGNCGSSASTATTITVLNTVTIATAGPDQNLCAATSATLNGNNPAVGETVSWSQIKGNAVVFSATNIPNPVISNLQAGTYSFVYTITNNVCPATADTVNIVVNPAIVNMIDTITKTICEGQSITITGQDATGGNGKYQYQWQTSNDGFNWSDLTGETNRDVTIIAKGSIYLRRLVSSLPCTSASNPVHINVQAAISNNTIASDQSICINTPAALLNGSLPAGATGSYTYEWQQSIDSGKTWITIPNAINQNYNPGVLKATTSFRRNVTSGYCIGAQANTSNVVTVVINPDAKASFTYSKDTSCPPFNIDTTVITTNNFNARNGSYNWYANNKFIGNGAAFPGYVLANGNDSVIIKLITVSSFGCKDDTMQHKFYTRLNAAQPAFTLSNTEGCGPLTVNITNQTPNLNSFTYKWNFGNGLTSTLKNPGNIIFRANPNYGDTIYTVSLTVYSACDSITTSQNVKVRSAVQALFKPDRTIGCSPMTVTFTNYSGGATDFTWNFDDGTIVNTTQTGSIQHTFRSAIQDTFRVSLIARSQCGNDTQYYSIVISPNNIRLLLTVNGNQKFGCSPHSVQLINNSKGATSFRWDFGDGNVLTTTRNIDTITHEYLLPGTYTVKLHASNNCSDTATTETVTVYAKPVVNFSLLPASVCIGDSIRFTNLSDTITGLSWNFGDGTFSNLTNPTHKYSAAGVYTVSLIGIRQYPSGSACIDSASKTATIVSSLPGSFTMSDSVGSCTPFTVTFTNNSLPSKSTVWDFGDGKKDSGNVVKHTYLTTGTFNVTMIATHPGGCNYQDTKKVTVKGPTGTFVYDNAIKCDNSPVRFEATTSGVDSLRWDFGDGTVIHSTNNIVYHIYPKPGNYVPTVELFAGTTCRQLLVGPDTIRVDFIKAGFTQTSIADCGNTNVSFRDTSRAFTNVLSYAWKFGDGATASTQYPTHNYKEANTWTVQLISTSKYGCVDTATHPVSVKLNNIPIASIISDSTSCANTRITYSSSVVSKDTILSYRWNFTNGFNSNGTTTNNIYANAGTYKATLIVSTINGCIDTASKSITINPAPSINASPDQTICLGQSVQLNATGGSGYSWGPLTNLSCINCSSPIANPVKTTRYTVSAFNGFGCMGVDTVTISIAQPFKIKPSLNDTLCIGETTQLFANGADKYKWSPSSGLNSTDVANPIASPSLTTRYRVIGSDSNNCFTDTAYLTVAVGKYPTVKIGDDKVLSAGSLYPFNPIVTNGPIVKWDWKPANDLSCNNCGTPTANIKKDITYSVNVTNNYGCTASDTMSIKVFCQSAQVFIPNVFTPDGDGVNDVLMVRGSGINTVKLFRVFNRWGEVVFEKSNFSPNEKSSGWDGMVRGKKAPTDVYVYTCEVTCENGNSFVYKGNVAIIK